MTSANKTLFFLSLGIAVGLFFLAAESDSLNQFLTIAWVYTAWKIYKQDLHALVFTQKILFAIAVCAALVGGVTFGGAPFDLLAGVSPTMLVVVGLTSFCAHFWLWSVFNEQMSSELLSESVARVGQAINKLDKIPQEKQFQSTLGVFGSIGEARSPRDMDSWLWRTWLVIVVFLVVFIFEGPKQQGSVDRNLETFSGTPQPWAAPNYVQYPDIRRAETIEFDDNPAAIGHITSWTLSENTRELAITLINSSADEFTGFTFWTSASACEDHISFGNHYSASNVFIYPKSRSLFRIKPNVIDSGGTVRCLGLSSLE